MNKTQEYILKSATYCIAGECFFTPFNAMLYGCSLEHAAIIATPFVILNGFMAPYAEELSDKVKAPRWAGSVLSTVLAAVITDPLETQLKNKYHVDNKDKLEVFESKGTQKLAFEQNTAETVGVNSNRINYYDAVRAIQPQV